MSAIGFSLRVRSGGRVKGRGEIEGGGQAAMMVSDIANVALLMKVDSFPGLIVSM